MPTAAILAGGRASRFGGRDKSALLVGGRSILDRQMTELAQIADDILVVGAPSCLRSEGSVRLVTDRLPDCGPMGGLDAALAAARHDALVVVACDMPFVTAPFLRHLLALTREAEAVVPRTERGYHPLCAAYTRACRAAVARCLAEGRLKMSELLRDLRVREVSTAEIEPFGDRDRLLANVNTPAEFEALEALQGHEL